MGGFDQFNLFSPDDITHELDLDAIKTKFENFLKNFNEIAFYFKYRYVLY